jgi:hypothetical protein
MHQGRRYNLSAYLVEQGCLSSQSAIDSGMVLRMKFRAFDNWFNNKVMSAVSTTPVFQL